MSIAFFGGRPAMISATTRRDGTTHDHASQRAWLTVFTGGKDTVLFTGVIQIIAGYFKVAKLMRFVSQSVVYGFLNVLAILIFMAQLPELSQMNHWGYAFVALGLAVIYLFPYLPKVGKSHSLTAYLYSCPDRFGAVF